MGKENLEVGIVGCVGMGKSTILNAIRNNFDDIIALGQGIELDDEKLDVQDLDKIFDNIDEM